MAQFTQKSQFAIFSTFFIIFTLHFNGANSHTMGLGDCPRISPMKDFDIDKFTGVWYVIQKFATQSSCMKYNFTKGVDSRLRLVQTRQHFLLDTIGVDHIYTYTGLLSTPDSDTPARMRVRFPLNFAGDASFIVYNTDYKEYGAIFTCQKILFGHTKSATILSRSKTLDKAIINQLKQQLDEFGVDSDDFSIVEQAKCIDKDDASLNVKIDDKTFSANNVAGVVQKVGGIVGSGVAKAGDTLGTGVSLAANLTSTFVESLGEKEKEIVPSTNEKLKDLINNAKNSENEAEWLP